MSPALIAWRLLTRLLEPLAPRLLDARAKQGKEDPARVDERLGRAAFTEQDRAFIESRPLFFLATADA